MRTDGPAVARPRAPASKGHHRGPRSAAGRPSPPSPGATPSLPLLTAVVVVAAGVFLFLVHFLFAKCQLNTWQNFAEYLMKNTRQTRFCRVLGCRVMYAVGGTRKIFAECIYGFACTQQQEESGSGPNRLLLRLPLHWRRCRQHSNLRRVPGACGVCVDRPDGCHRRNRRGAARGACSVCTDHHRSKSMLGPHGSSRRACLTRRLRLAPRRPPPLRHVRGIAPSTSTVAAPK